MAAHARAGVRNVHVATQYTASHGEAWRVAHVRRIKSWSVLVTVASADILGPLKSSSGSNRTDHQPSSRERIMKHLPLLSTLTLTLCSQSLVAQSSQSDQIIIAANQSNGSGVLSVVQTAPPWPATPSAAKSSHDAIVRTFNGKLYVLGREAHTVRVHALPSLTLIAKFSIDHVLAPHDLVMVGDRMALISDYDSPHLWWLDTKTGDLTVGQDLSPYADADGLPDIAMMEVVGIRVYVQMQRFDRNTFTDYGAKLAVLAPGFSPIPPVILENVIDLSGVRPDYRMHVNDAGNRLFLSAPGVDNDWGGWVNTGIEEVDLNTGQSLGFVVTEFQFGADLGGFVMVDDNLGFAICHTSIFASTHLRAFRRNVGQLAELHTTPGRLESIAYDRVRGQIVYPVVGSGFNAGGVLIFDAVTYQQLSSLIPVDGDPFDMIVVQ
jgi:hypothetical protein